MSKYLPNLYTYYCRARAVHIKTNMNRLVELLQDIFYYLTHYDKQRKVSGDIPTYLRIFT